MYRLHGGQYGFGAWPLQLFYEYLKDVRTYAGILAVVALYRLALWRLRGEARLLAEPDVGEAVEPVARPERFLVKKLGKEFLLPAGEIEWVQAWGNYVNLHVRGRDHPLRSTLTSLQSRLDPQQFARVHRSYIVNLAQIAAIEPQDGGDADLLLHSGQRIPCSRTYRDALRERLAAETA
jgi:DNA-binding LytR/AlgR family response regulator